MCRFKSGIILKNKVVVAPGKNDSHDDLLESLGIKDDYMGATRKFVRVELVPKNNKWWVSPEEYPDEWIFVIDQDVIPDWFDKEKSEKVFQEAVCVWWKEHILVKQKIDELNNGFYCLKQCEVKRLCNDVCVLLYDSQVGEMCDSSQVSEMRGSSRVGEMWNSSQVSKMYDSSQVSKMFHNSQVSELWNSSQVSEMFHNSRVGEMCDRSQVSKMRGSSQVGEMWDRSQVSKMRGSSQVGEMWDRSQVSKMYDNSQVSKMYDSSQVGEMRSNSMVKDFKDYPHIKIWVSEDGNFETIVHKPGINKK